MDLRRRREKCCRFYGGFTHLRALSILVAERARGLKSPGTSEPLSFEGWRGQFCRRNSCAFLPKPSISRTWKSLCPSQIGSSFALHWKSRSTSHLNAPKVSWVSSRRWLMSCCSQLQYRSKVDTTISMNNGLISGRAIFRILGSTYGTASEKRFGASRIFHGGTVKTFCSSRNDRYGPKYCRTKSRRQ